MRDKQDILKESLDSTHKIPVWDLTARLHERLTVEVLIDIRDVLSWCHDKLALIARE